MAKVSEHYPNLLIIWYSKYFLYYIIVLLAITSLLKQKSSMLLKHTVFAAHAIAALTVTVVQATAPV